MIMEAARSHSLRAIPCPRAEDRRLSSSRRAGKGYILPSSAFCCGQALRGLDDAHPHWEGRELPRVPSQMLTSPGNTATDAPGAAHVPSR